MVLPSVLDTWCGIPNSSPRIDLYDIIVTILVTVKLDTWDGVGDITADTLRPTLNKLDVAQH